jgi:hypothetical protein
LPSPVSLTYFSMPPRADEPITALFDLSVDNIDERVGFDVFPAASDGKCQQNITQLALGVSRRAAPGSLGPEQIVHLRTHAAMHAGAQVNQSLGLSISAVRM